MERTRWYWKIGNVGGEDWYNFKRTAVLAVKEYIDELKGLQ
jgi:hypothetical protein